MAYQPWYTYNRIDNYGYYPDPEGAFPKPDSNIIGLPDGTPITALGSGTISGINNPFILGAVPSWGQVITVKLDQPYNSVATHMAYLHLGSIAPGISLGQHVDVGDVLGYSGSSVSGAATGFAFYNGDSYGYGPSWSQYVGSSQLDPTAFLNIVQMGGLSTTNQSSGDTRTTNLNTGITLPSAYIPPPTNGVSSNWFGLDLNKIVDASLFTVIGITLIIVGTLLLMNKLGVTQAIGNAAKTAVVAA